MYNVVIVHKLTVLFVDESEPKYVLIDIFRMVAVPANFNFQIGSIAENVLNDLHYNYAKVNYAYRSLSHS